ncbi:LVIVD repeat-containing protein [Actinocrispum wychmicini]|uniref:LVIVD repeat-containing protein n=1 Tax=Actinocrispum wychmicini TaxID=1213861 RepID=A0A4V2S5X6_9PSEU|nr:hypothetical protein [Actinocrispum wychmicini]TCO53570.1 hypothetical protein EV192_110159 [Actinocrispum wychmicini]
MRKWLSTVAVSTAVLTFASTSAMACGEDDMPGAKPAAQAKIAGAPDAVKNVKLLANLPEAQGAISISFLQYGWRDVMMVSGQFGLKAYDLANPAKPKLVGELNIPGMWETENTEVDQHRKLVFLSRDPRAFGGNTHTGESGIYVVDARRPEKLSVLSFVDVPAGHTTSCINDCQFLWTGGPAKADNQPAEWGGRPIWVTDVRDPKHPKVNPNPIELARNDGKTDYVHDVQVDSQGVAWASGRGGVRGYWTNGVHRDPVTGKFRRATANNPVPYAGGKISELTAPSTFMHNSYRPPGTNLLYITEESFNDGCATDGVLVIASLKGSFNGEGWRSTPQQPFRLTSVSSWGVAGQEGSDPASDDCSAHYFDVNGHVLVQSFYSQGTRFLDVSDPTNPRQIAYYRPADAKSWQPVWHRGLVYVADNVRGVDVLKLGA